MVALAASAGIYLDGWQQADLEVACGERADGRWAAFEVALINQRQNGKGEELLARQLAGLFLFGERLQTHTAHRVDTCLEHFERVKAVIKGTPDLLRRVAKITETNGAQAIKLHSGQRLIFRARTKGAGRGFTGDVVYLDEAFYLALATLGGMVPTMSAKAITGNPQLWYASSAPLDGPESEVLRNLCRRGRTGDASLAYIEYSADPDLLPPPHERIRGGEGYEARLAEVLPTMLEQANPALGIRISADFSVAERASLGEADWLRERFGIWVDPKDDEGPDHVLGRDNWTACADPSSSPAEPVRFALDVSLSRSHAAFGAAGPCPDGTHVEVVDYRPGTDWVVDRAVELQTRWGGPLSVAAKSPAAALVPDLIAAGVEVVEVSVEDHSLACAHLVDEVAGHRVRHLDDTVLTGAVKAAEKRWYGNESFLWSRKNSAGDICPLVAVTIAAWATTVEVDEGGPNLW